MKDIDTGKIGALYMAGWPEFLIADEMNISEREVGEILDRIAETQRTLDAAAEWYEERSNHGDDTARDSAQI